jgi:AraC family transcriptional regulator, regulatory protein of adaptative response / DNA-3-methyladenine glycosylase II
MAGSGGMKSGPPRSRRLRYRPPLAMAPLMRFLGDRALPGVESFDGRTFRRAIRAGGGPATVLELTPSRSGHHVTLRVGSDGTEDRAYQTETARRLLDLDADPMSIDGVLAADPVLRPLVRATPGIRLPGAVDGFEMTVRAVLGQQVSVRAARTFAGRIVAAAGTPLEDPAEEVTHLFPTPRQMIDADLRSVGLTGARGATVRRLAELVDAGRLDLTDTADAGETTQGLLDVPGIGWWTAAYVAMRVLRDPDAFPVEDLGVRLGFEALGLPSTPAAIRDHAERWRPWRAYAVMHLWNADR